MAYLSTTRMMNLLTLVLVTLPGLTFSFSYINPWRVLIEAKGYPLSEKPENYVCCNQPYTSPTPHISQSKMRSLIFTLAKRDDRNAPFREIWMDASRRVGDRGASLSNIPGVRQAGGSFSSPDAMRRDPLMTGILHLLRSSGRHRSSSLVLPDALSNSARDSSSPVDFDASALVGKRTGGRIIPGKRSYGDLGGANMDWE